MGRLNRASLREDVPFVNPPPRLAIARRSGEARRSAHAPDTARAGGPAARQSFILADPAAEMIAPAPGGVLLAVRIVPRAGRSGVAGIRDGALLVRVNAPPVEGAANAELIEVLARLLDVPKRAVTIVAGERSRLKRVRVEGMTVEDVNAKCRMPNAQ